ncbi:MAG: M23 family metallopeptidase [Pseudomonadota bacterium]
MIRQIITGPVRNDRAGAGYFGAPRGGRKHRGVDYVVTPGNEVLSPVSGTVERLGWAYARDDTWRIVDIRAVDGFLHRVFYVEPMVDAGQEVTRFTVIGLAQDISAFYPDSGMKPHVHYEVINTEGRHIDPEEWL